LCYKCFCAYSYAPNTCQGLYICNDNDNCVHHYCADTLLYTPVDRIYKERPKHDPSSGLFLGYFECYEIFDHNPFIPESLFSTFIAKIFSFDVNTQQSLVEMAYNMLNEAYALELPFIGDNRRSYIELVNSGSELYSVMSYFENVQDNGIGFIYSDDVYYLTNIPASLIASTIMIGVNNKDLVDISKNSIITFTSPLNVFVKLSTNNKIITYNACSSLLYMAGTQSILDYSIYNIYAIMNNVFTLNSSKLVSFEIDLENVYKKIEFNDVPRKFYAIRTKKQKYIENKSINVQFRNGTYVLMKGVIDSKEVAEFIYNGHYKSQLDMHGYNKGISKDLI